MRLAILTAAVLLVPLVARGEGLVLGVSIGPGVSTGPLTWSGQSRPLGNPGEPMAEPRDLTLFGVGAYLTLSVDTRLGVAVSDEVLAGVEGEATLLGGPGPTLGHTRYLFGLTVAGGAVATWHRPGTQMILSATAGVAMSKFTGGIESIGTEDNIASYEDVLGPMVKASMGWKLSPTTRAELEARLAAQWSEHMVYVPLSLTFRVRAGLL